MPSDTVSAPPESWVTLGRLVTERRTLELGLTQAEAARGDLSQSSLGKIEAGRSTRYRGATIRSLEDALGWQRGSVRRILDGVAPAIACAAPAAAPPHHARRAGAGGFDVDYVHRPHWSPERQIDFEELVRRAADLIFGTDVEANPPASAVDDV